MATRNLAIMFTDIQGFTARTSVSTREGINHLLDVHETLLKPVFSAFRGTIVKTIGDAFLVWFESPTDAVLCGLTIQEVLRQRNEKVTSDEEKLHVRVAINAGDVEIRTDEKTGAADVFGEAVNLAARLEGITEAGEVWFTEAVYLTMNRAEAPSTEIGERTFKGIPNPVRVYKVIYEPGSEQARALASRVKLDGGGRASISREMPRPRVVAGPSLGRTLGLAAAVAVAIGGLALAMRYSGPARMHAAVMRAKKHVLMHQDVAALDELGRAGQRNPLDPSAVDLARVALQSEIDARTAKKEPKAQTLKWLHEIETRHPALAPIVDEKIPYYDVYVFARKQIEETHGEADERFWDPVRQKLQEYDGNKDVHLATAEGILDSKLCVGWVTIWLWQKAFENGHAPDPRAFDAALSAFEMHGPDESTAADGRELAIRWFPEKISHWAKETLRSDTKPYHLLNALAVLEETKDPAATEPDAVALRDVLLGNDVAAAKKTLAKLPLEKKARAKALLDDAAESFSFPKSNRQDAIAVAALLK